MNAIHTYLSERSFPLVFNGLPTDTSILTVENYIKWYDLYLVMPNGSVKKANFREWHDHVPNPRECLLYAEKHGYEWDESSLDMITGRFYREILQHDLAVI